MSTTKRRKSAKETRVLVASIITAAAIVAGSTFAWFSSSDEVTNRLSANADYGVTIAEDFTPPENWLPGQTVEKNVGVVNTGNVDAFVRTWLEGEMDLIAQTKSEIAAQGFTGTGLTKVTDAQLKAVGLTYKNENGVYFKELKKTGTFANPTLSAQVSTNAYTEVQAVQAGGILVSVPEGAKFRFQPNQAININNLPGEDVEIPKDANVVVTINPTAEKDIEITPPADPEGGNYEVTAKSIDAFEKIDSDRFIPQTTGLYIFRRNVALADPRDPEAVDDFELTGYFYNKDLPSDDDTTTGPVTYYADAGLTTEVTPVTSGFYAENDEGVITYYATEADIPTGKSVTPALGSLYVDTATTTYYTTVYTPQSTATTAPGTFFALEYDDGDTQNSDYVLANGKGGTQENPANPAVYTYTMEPDGSYTFADTGIKLFTAQEKNVLNKDLKWTFTEATGTGETAVPAQFHVFYDFDTTDNSTYEAPDKRDIVIDIDLDNIGTGAEQWTKMSAEGKTDTFYYNNDLEAGATTAKLVDAVTLNKEVTQYAFLAFDFDLNVFMDSVQVYVDKDGNEGFESVKATFAESEAGSNIVSATATETVGNPEIETITWGAAATDPQPGPQP